MLFIGGSMDFQQSQSYQNLISAYNWELKVSTEYSIFGDQARREEYIEIGNTFDRISLNEREHARIWLRRINNGELPITSENLSYCAQLEAQSGNVMYRDYARVAREEGYDDLAALFNGVANIELIHNLQFLELYEDVVRNQVFCKERGVLWICLQCGNILSGDCAPEICPVCGFPQGYYTLYNSTSG
jgi:rubrerythrin